MVGLYGSLHALQGMVRRMSHSLLSSYLRCGPRPVVLCRDGLCSVLSWDSCVMIYSGVRLLAQEDASTRSVCCASGVHGSA
jgi:hypothetical protein